MIDSVGFNSSTLYRYANVNLDSLKEQLGDTDAAAKAASLFVESFIRSMPTGKQNSYANRTLPETCIVAFRKEQPINAVSAFEQPVKAQDGRSISDVASRRLVEGIKKIQDAYDQEPQAAFVVSTNLSEDDIDGVARPVDLRELKTLVEQEAESELGGQEGA